MVYVVIVSCLVEIHFSIKSSNFWLGQGVLTCNTHPRLSFLLTCSCFRKSYCNVVFQVSQVSQALTTHILLIGNIKEEKLFEVLNESKRKTERPASFQRELFAKFKLSLR